MTEPDRKNELPRNPRQFVIDHIEPMLCPFCKAPSVTYDREHISSEHRFECDNCGTAVHFDVDMATEKAMGLYHEATRDYRDREG